MTVKTIELNVRGRPYANIHTQIMQGDIFVVRNCLKEIGLLEDMEEITNTGISELFGTDIAERIRRAGIEKIHTILKPEEILEVTEYAYKIARTKCSGFLKIFVQEIFLDCQSYYFERKANVRFHLPFDLTVGKEELVNSYVRRIGPGKINPHKPHRDSWVSQPSNVINIWVAAGPVDFGNGLIIYPSAYKRNIKRRSRYIRNNEDPGPGMTFSLKPGDVLLFHSEHLHSSEINSTNSTRHVISFRLAFEKPRYEFGHYSNYAYSALADGPWDMIADLPQNLAWSYVRCRTVGRMKNRLKRLAKKLLKRAGYEIRRRPASISSGIVGDFDALSGQLPDTTNPAKTSNGVWVLSDSLCVTKTETGQITVFERFCPHQGADLSFGTLRAGKILCPWHNLPIDLKTGLSPCKSLKKLKVYPCIADGDLRDLFLKEFGI